jgi:hypothetical protein
VCWDYVLIEAYQDIVPEAFWITVGRETKDCEL